MGRRLWAVVASAVIAVGCSGGDADDPNGADGDAVSVDAGAGVLILNGAEFPLSAATCILDDDTFDAGAVGPDGLRVFATLNNPANAVSAQILDAEQVQWFPQDVQGDEASRDGDTITSPTHTYFNNQNDLTIEASFTIACP